MENIVSISYQQNGNSVSTSSLGMREMQAKAFGGKNHQFILLKAPPASGKSRALMFIGLDKIRNQNLKKVIVAVPERSIGGSFGFTALTENGFFEDWKPTPRFDLCSPGGESRKVDAFVDFMSSDEEILICTHATLRFAFSKLKSESFNDCLLAIDEFHHVSAATENILGELIRDLMSNSDCHILAMTGSYFRGDSVPVLMPEDEAKFHKVTYNYYEQLNGYKYLKSLGIGYHFYQGKYTDTIDEVLDTDKKTILHIPNVNTGESTKDKLREVDEILDKIGRVIEIDSESKIIKVLRDDGKEIKIADLVNDNPSDREKTITYLRNIKDEGDIDLIIALGMAKEGFDWPFCEHALTVGYRGSLTEIIQIIGRCTRDSENKEHAQFTNLIAEPDADSDEILKSVNNMLKAITASLLMEQVLAPNFKFRSKGSKQGDKNDIIIDGYKSSNSSRVQNILNADLTDLKASILQDPTILKAMPGNVDPEVINTVMIPKVVKVRYPNLTDEEVGEISQYVVIDSVLRSCETKENENKKLIKMANKFINIEDLNIDLINSINPFLEAFEVISKNITPRVLKSIQQCISAFKITMTDDEAIMLWPKINEFIKATGRHPILDSLDPSEKRMAEAVVYLREIKRREKGDEG
ncbi:helicase-related protein [Flavobacteriales bacterium]|nr:helicase-related protein [Flavobacteriales bacterium]